MLGLKAGEELKAVETEKAFKANLCMEQLLEFERKIE